VEEMISRTWHGAVPIENKEAFLAYEYETGIKDTTSIPGNWGAFLKVVEQDEYAHFFLCTIWEDMESVINFAGSSPKIAVTYPRDRELGLISDPIVILQEVATAKNPFEDQEGY
jgi:heme-degrading monooxygenase HmoA